MGVTLKSLVIIGVPRSGKTTLARCILGLFSENRQPVAFLSADSIIGGLTNVQKQNFFWGVFVRPMRHIIPGLAKKTKHERINNMLTFVARFIRETGDIVPVVYEGAYITPETAKKTFDLKKCMVVVIGYPDCAVGDKIADIRKFDKKTPYSKRTSNELETIIAQNIEKSKKMRESAEKLGFMFIDTSNDYDGAIKSAAKKIYRELNKK